MNDSSRKQLSLSKKSTSATPDEEREFELDLFEVLLPCRNFQVAYRFAEVGSVSLVTEFLLRLVHATDQILEKDLAAFFGFDDREMRFALDEVSANGYISRRDGTLALTSIGRSLFKYDQKVPQIYSVESRRSTYGFDLIALAPQESTKLSRFEYAFKELHVSNAERVSRASKEIRTSFRRWYYDFMSRTERDRKRTVFLYSIDEVSAGRRYPALVPVLLRSSPSRPSNPELDLSFWRTPTEIEDRSAIVESVAAYVEDLKVLKGDDDSLAYSILEDIAPEFLSEYTLRNNTLSVDRYFSETTKRAGELRIDRPTVPLVGSLFTPGNLERLKSALDYTAKVPAQAPEPDGVHWLVPICHWGQTRVLGQILDEVTPRGEKAFDEDTPPPPRVGYSSDRPSAHAKEAFDRFVQPVDSSEVPPSLEILLVPGRVAAVLVHCPILTNRGIPVPLGVLSFDPPVVERARSFLEKNFRAGVLSPPSA